MHCKICLSPRQNLQFKNIGDYEYGTYRAVDYYRCEDCGLIYQDPLPEPENIASFYPRNYRNLQSLDQGLFALLKHLQFQAQARRLIPSSEAADIKILELGFGNGLLLRSLSKLGFKNLFGADLSNRASQELQELRIKIKDINVEEEFPFEENFDYIIMNNVVEHFLDPWKVLKTCKEHLNPGAKLVMITPNTGSLDLAIFGKFWAGFHAPRHTFLFNPKNLRQLAQDLGFSQVGITADFDPGQWAISTQNLLQNHQVTQSPLHNGLAPYTTILSLVYLPVTWLQAVFHRSTNFICVLTA